MHTFVTDRIPRTICIGTMYIATETVIDFRLYTCKFQLQSRVRGAHDGEGHRKLVVAKQVRRQ